MELTKKELIPYLPYDIGAMFDGKIYGIIVGIDMSSSLFEIKVIEEIDNNTPIYKNWCLFDTKPLLRPLSDLTKEITHNGETFVPIERIEYMNEFGSYLFIQQGKNSQNYGQLDWWTENENGFTFSEMLDIYNFLLELHFDIFNLIENNLAIDLNTIQQ